jgi:hypothetical protein
MYKKVVADIAPPRGHATRFVCTKVAGSTFDHIKVSGSTFVRAKVANSAFDFTKNCIKVAGIKLDYIKVSGSTFVRDKVANSAFDCTKIAGSTFDDTLGEATPVDLAKPLR